MAQLSGEAVDRGLLRAGFRVLVLLVGATTVLVGLVLIPLPGPGSLIVFLGISLLGREFAWAHRLSARIRRDVGQAVALCPSRPARVALGAFGVLSLIAPVLLLLLLLLR